jgi:hypothetical protein
MGAPVTTTSSAYLRVPASLSAEGLSATAFLELEDWGGGSAALRAYFRDLAANWKGWIGEKRWADDQGTAELVASHDGLGSISLRVRLVVLGGDRDEGAWVATATVIVDAGALEEAAVAMDHLLAVPKP